MSAMTTSFATASQTIGTTTLIVVLLLMVSLHHSHTVMHSRLLHKISTLNRTCHTQHQLLMDIHRELSEIGTTLHHFMPLLPNHKRRDALAIITMLTTLKTNILNC